MIHITSKLHGVEVAGMRHPANTVHYSEDQIEPEQLAAFMESEYLTVEIDGPEGQTITIESRTIETGAGDAATGDGVDDASTGDDAMGDEVDAANAGEDVTSDITGENVPTLDGTVEKAPESAAITEAQSIAQAQPEPAAETATTVEKKPAPATTRKPKK